MVGFTVTFHNNQNDTPAIVELTSIQHTTHNTPTIFQTNNGVEVQWAQFVGFGAEFLYLIYSE